MVWELAEVGMCFLCFTKFLNVYKTLDSFFAELFARPQTTTISSFLSPSLFFLAVFILTSSPIPGLT